MGILSGIHVLDLATYIAAPAAATVMSDFGAEVIKVERPPYGDPYRYLHLVPGMPVSEEQYCWILEARNKQSLGMNLTHPNAADVLERLVRWADVLITNFQPLQLEKFRLRYEDVVPWNERLIYAQVTGYGETGEERDSPGFDSTAYWARSGLMGIMHVAGADPVQSPAGFGDHPTSMSVFGAIMMGLYSRERTGKGCKVSTSLLANGAWSNSCQLQATFVGAEWPVRRTRVHPNNPLVNHYLSRDGHRFMLCMLEPERDWIRLCCAFEWTELKHDARYRTPQGRRENAKELVALIDAAAAKRDLQELAELFAAHGVVWARVPVMKEVAADSQMQAIGVFEKIAGTDWNTVMSPIEMQGEPKTKPRLAPKVGQHSVSVLQLLGYEEETIQRLLSSGAVYSATEFPE